MNNSTTGLEIVQPQAVAGAAGDAAGVPCLNSDISTEGGLDLGVLTAQHKRTSFVLAESVQRLSALYGLERLGFLTLTFSDHVTCPKEAQRRLNSLITHVIKQRYLDYVGVFERQKSGRIHYHFLVALRCDIRTGVDFEGLANRDYSSANRSLKMEWAFWRRTTKKYRFGRSEMLPVKSSTEAIGRYVGKYIAKHVSSRKDEDKGVRLVRYSRGARAGTTRFQFHSVGAASWRSKVAVFAEIVRCTLGEDINDISDLARVLGPRWAYRHREYILAIELPGDDTTAPAMPTVEARGAVCLAGEAAA